MLFSVTGFEFNPRVPKINYLLVVYNIIDSESLTCDHWPGIARVLLQIDKIMYNNYLFIYFWLTHRLSRWLSIILITQRKWWSRILDKEKQRLFDPREEILNLNHLGFIFCKRYIKKNVIKFNPINTELNRIRVIK